jgi:hypothetical protein
MGAAVAFPSLAPATDAQVREQTATGVGASPANLAGRACFLAHKNGTNQTGIANNTATKVTFGAETFDVGGLFDTTNSRWTPPTGTKVRIGGMVYVSAGVLSSGGNQLLLYKNGALLRALDIHAASALATEVILSGSTIESADGGYYELYVSVLTSSAGVDTATAFGNASYTYFYGEQV